MTRHLVLSCAKLQESTSLLCRRLWCLDPRIVVHKIHIDPLPRKRTFFWFGSPRVKGPLVSQGKLLLFAGMYIVMIYLDGSSPEYKYMYSVDQLRPASKISLSYHVVLRLGIRSQSLVLLAKRSSYNNKVVTVPIRL